jgi:pimeloyl-ACP methyl ester carboxylesterase
VVTVNGVELCYKEFGSPDGIPVVALHGHPSTADTWDEVAKRLTAPGRYRFLAFTQRGYSPSGRAPSYSFAALRDDVFGFADALGLGQFVLIGHSMGGTVAAFAASQKPDRLLALVLEDTAPPREGLRAPARPDGELPYDWALVSAIFDELASPDPAWWADLANITVPTLVLAGGSTSHVPQDLLADAAALMPQARLITLEGAGHTAHRDQPDRFLAEVISFLDSVCGA